MTIQEGARLRVQWKLKGKPACKHDTLSIEEVPGYGLTGIYICRTCGELLNCAGFSGE